MYSSTILALRAKGSPFFPLSNHSHSSLADRFDRCSLHFSSSSSSSSCCSCCCCCCACYGHSSAAVHRGPISPTFLYGLRQSSLLQWSASRRLILGGGDRGYYRVPGYGVGRDIYQSSCVSKERSNEGRRSGSRRRRRIVRCTVSEEDGEIRRLSRFQDAEAVLSLLSEEVCEESFGGRGRKGASSGRRTETEKKRTYGGELSKGRKRNVRSDFMERDSKHKLESVDIESKEECRSCREKRESELRQEESKLRKDASSCSSYYSLSSSGDLESYSEEIEDDKLVGNSSFSYNEDSLVKEWSRMQKEASEELKRNRESREEAEVSRREESTLRSNAEWDWRKTSEKKLNGVSIDDTQSTKESSLVHSRISRTHEQDGRKVPTSRRQFTGVDEKLDLTVNLDARGRNSYSQTEDGAVGSSELRKKAEMSAEVCRVCGSDVTLSSFRERLSTREDNIGVTAESAGELGDYIQESVERRNWRTSGGVGIQEINSETASELHRESDARVSNRKESTGFTSISAHKREQQKILQRDEEIHRQSELKRSQQFTDLSETHQNIERTYISNRQHQEENVNLVSSSVSNCREHYSEIAQEDARLTKHSRDESKDPTIKLSQQATERETTSSSQRTYREKMAGRGNNITVVVNVGDGVGKSRGESSRRVSQTGSQNEARWLTKVLSSPANIPRLIDRAEDQVGEDKGSSTLTTPPAPQVLVRGLTYIGQTSREEAPEGKFAGARAPELKPEVETGDGRCITYGTLINQSAHEDALGSAPRSDQLSNQVVGEFIEKARHEVSSSEMHPVHEDALESAQHSDQLSNQVVVEFIEKARHEVSSSEMHPAHEDALESARRSDQLSNQIVGEFIEKARHEVPSSEIQTKTSETELTRRRQDQTRTSSSHFGSEIQMKGGGSRNSSNDSGTKGPSDETWLETEASMQVPPKTEVQPPEGSVESGQAIVKRTGRSLWNIMADIVRLRWGSSAETPRSASRSGKKSSSNESVSSEAWFSGRVQGSTPLEAITPLNRTQSTSASVRSQAESSSSDKNRRCGEQVSSPLTSSSSSVSKVTASADLQEDSDLHEDTKQLESSNAPLAIELVEPLTSPVTLGATVVIGEVDQSLGVSKERRQAPGQKLTVVSGMEAKDGELKQRKLQRKKQVPKDSFDEWEEAYVLESEQRKIDEMFMREALIEAKKAADNWEVPVGAVLVQHGKIIARGYNLVEELRDSTAHAEMLCIREASNVLRSWRLADSTLYVTLEPCPMCAGAILQARIDTLVWGAPNKLLGADGSWIRIFPIGEGSSGSETVEKQPPPAHPFHPNMTIRRGVLASECADTMQQFFQLRRRKKEKKPEEEPPTHPSCLPVAPHPLKLLNKMHDIFHITFCL